MIQTKFIGTVQDTPKLETKLVDGEEKKACTVSLFNPHLNEDGKGDTTETTAYDSKAEALANFKKGAKVAIEGSFEKRDGKYFTLADKVESLEKELTNDKDNLEI